MIATPHIILYGLFENLHMFPPGFAEVHVVWIIFVTFSTLALSFSYLRFYESVRIDYGYLLSATLHA